MGKSLIITFENGIPRIPAICIEGANMVREIRGKILEKYPKLGLKDLRLNICDKRSGSIGRNLLKDEKILAEEVDELFVSLYLN